MIKLVRLPILDRCCLNVRFSESLKGFVWLQRLATQPYKSLKCFEFSSYMYFKTSRLSNIDLKISYVTNLTMLWQPFCTTTYFYAWHRHVILSCKGQFYLNILDHELYVIALSRSVFKPVSLPNFTFVRSIPSSNSSLGDGQVAEK